MYKHSYIHTYIHTYIHRYMLYMVCVCVCVYQHYVLYMVCVCVRVCVCVCVCVYVPALETPAQPRAAALKHAGTAGNASRSRADDAGGGWGDSGEGEEPARAGVDDAVAFFESTRAGLLCSLVGLFCLYTGSLLTLDTL